ncbi:MAG: nucleotidyltransferase domain-containing protein [Bdellovibrionaceae bacterium]|nr:nucleotidyltransferase domain-containing protein [Pseudobdellovibrionaceae bacterium]
MHKPEWYWTVQDEFVDIESRGAINIPISDDLEISGWDLKKALDLLLKSNPPLFEWLRSPIIYQQEKKVAAELLQLSEKF